MKTKETLKYIDKPIDYEEIKEKIMFDAIHEKITKFYEDPKNVQAFEEWRKKKNEQ